jgi:hypothetical protein
LDECTVAAYKFICDLLWQPLRPKITTGRNVTLVTAAGKVGLY